MPRGASTRTQRMSRDRRVGPADKVGPNDGCRNAGATRRSREDWNHCRTRLPHPEEQEEKEGKAATS